VSGFHAGGSGTPVVLLHGVAGTWRVWAPVIPLLEERHSVFAPTLPGHCGGEALALNAPVTVAALVDRLAAELDRRQIDRAHLVGNSLGGWLALELARRGRARSVVVFGSAGAWSSERRVRALAAGMRLAFAANRRCSRWADPIAARRALRTMFLGAQVAHPDQVPPEELAASIRSCLDAPAVVPLLRSITAQPFQSLPAEAARPIRVVWADRDKILPFEHYGRPLLDRLPGAELVRAPGIGHVPTWDAPGWVAGQILEVAAMADAGERSDA
jgi:pimeloyl-ACP methyl ester carboxylesterase